MKDMDDLRNVFDALVVAAGKVARADALRNQARAKAESGRAACGHCWHWLKSRQCPKNHNVNGHNRGPSMNGYPCSKYAERPEAQKYRDEAAELLADAEAIGG